MPLQPHWPRPSSGGSLGEHRVQPLSIRADRRERRAPVIRGRFVAGTQLCRETGEAIAVSRSANAFGVSGEHKFGIMGVEYQICSQVEPVT